MLSRLPPNGHGTQVDTLSPLSPEQNRNKPTTGTWWEEAEDTRMKLHLAPLLQLAFIATLALLIFQHGMCAAWMYKNPMIVSTMHIHTDHVLFLSILNIYRHGDSLFVRH